MVGSINKKSYLATSLCETRGKADFSKSTKSHSRFGCSGLHCKSVRVSVIMKEEGPVNRVTFLLNDKKNGANFFKSAPFCFESERFVFVIF